MAPINKKQKQAQEAHNAQQHIHHLHIYMYKYRLENRKRNTYLQRLFGRFQISQGGVVEEWGWRARILGQFDDSRTVRHDGSRFLPPAVDMTVTTTLVEVTTVAVFLPFVDVVIALVFVVLGIGFDVHFAPPFDRVNDQFAACGFGASAILARTLTTPVVSLIIVVFVIPFALHDGLTGRRQELLVP